MPTSRATRVTSAANELSWSSIVLTVVPMRRNSPLTGRPSICSDIFWERSPSATASSTRETSIVGRTRSSIIELTDSTDCAQVPFAPLSCARSVIRPSRPITLLTRPSSAVRPSRLSARLLNAFATSPMTPLFCAGRRTPVSPSLAERRASSSSCRSCLLNLDRAVRGRAAGGPSPSGFRLLVQPQLTPLCEGSVRRWTVGRRVSRLGRAFAPGGGNLTARRQ